MQIVIPMSGFGERFRRAGYEVPKPLIEIEGKPIIAHVIDMFPGETDFLFICNQDHLDKPEYRMKEILSHYCPTGKVVGIPSHKLGPVFAVSQVADYIKDDQPVVVNYCDFTCYWNWFQFKTFAEQSGCDGAIPAYKGFHPHTLGTTNYAYMQESNGWVSDIQEKQPYTDNRMEEYASSGTYYFSSGKLMKDAFEETIRQDLNVGGEFYVSLAYKPLFAWKKSVAVYPLQHFMQWGTPQDVAEYNNWSRVFRSYLTSENNDEETLGSVVVPMAGLGKRFADEGYSATKPLIPVSGQPMVLQASKDLPDARNYCFILRDDMPGYQDIIDVLSATYPGAVIKTLPSLTEGQACTALVGVEALLEAMKDGELGPVTIGACDNGALYDQKAFSQLISDPDVDVIVWGARGYANAVRNPGMYGWIKDAENGDIESISVKTPLDSPETDPIVTGTFTFKRASDFKKVVESLIERNGRINGEFYVDSCINDALSLGLNCRLFEIDSYVCWGTPNDLRTFEYWQSCFHKWEGHPYRLELDARVPEGKADELSDSYRNWQLKVPGLSDD